MPSLEANLVDIPGRTIKPVRLSYSEDQIESIEPLVDRSCDTYVLPGFIDAHIHVESSMLTPAQFAAAAVVHGTVATVSDPHEIANVLGPHGIEYMLDDAKRVPLKFCFGAPSCVPATAFETSGCKINVDDTSRLLDRTEIRYLAEMMNFPGVLGEDSEVLAKIEAAKVRGKPIDGHAPGLSKPDVSRYFAAGITTDHECSLLPEAIDRAEMGVYVQIREGSAARNFDALWPIIDQFPGRVMFCSDDKHPNELALGHINQLCRRAIANGCDLFHVLAAACITPAQHYDLNVGQLQVGDPADFIEVGSLTEFDVRRTFIDGACVAENGSTRLTPIPAQTLNHFHCTEKVESDFAVPANDAKRIRVIGAHDKLLTTSCLLMEPAIQGNQVVADPQHDLLKLSVINRYQDAPPAVAFAHGFGLHRGAIAGSVAHDSHNIIAVGTSDAELSRAVNAVINSEGGLAVVDGDHIETLALPVAGLMSNLPCADVVAQYERLQAVTKNLGCGLHDPFMTLSFMALLVIPALKLSDKGLFDVQEFKFVDLIAE